MRNQLVPNRLGPIWFKFPDFQSAPSLDFQHTYLLLFWWHTKSINWNMIIIRWKLLQVIKMEVECSNSRPPGPDSLTGEEEVNFAIMIIAITTVIIVITITINCVSTNVFAGGHGEVFRECKQMASCPRAQTGLTLMWRYLIRSNVSLDSEYLEN